MNRCTTSRIIRLFVLIVSIAFIGVDLTASAQNTNSSTTMPNDTTMQDSNTSNTNMSRTGGRRRRRGRRRGGNMNAAGTAVDVTLAPGQEIVTGRPILPGRCDPMAQEQTDLSGTYTGTANYAEGGLSGETTLTITGNTFTMTSGSSTQEGRVVAVTTCNYTAVTMMFGKEQTSAASGPQPAPLPAVSLRAKRVGNGLTLESVGGETRQFSFSSAGSRGRRGAAIPVGIKPPTAMTHGH